MVVDPLKELADWFAAVEGKYSPSQPRDNRGRWTRVGGIGRARTVDEAMHLLEGGHGVMFERPEQVVTLLNKLYDVAQDAKSKGAKAPVYDIGKVSVKGTNLFAQQNIGISRANMPQLRGVPTPGSPADSLPKDQKGEVDLGPAFKHYLSAKGHTVTDTTERADYLRASQQELDGAKVAGMMKSIENNLMPPGSIFTSNDNYVVDGHHRWAATVGASYEKGDTLRMDISRVDMPILPTLHEALSFANSMGIPQAGLGSKAALDPFDRLLAECVLMEAKYRPGQPRDDHGRWTVVGGVTIDQPANIDQLPPGPIAGSPFGDDDDGGEDVTPGPSGSNLLATQTDYLREHADRNLPATRSVGELEQVMAQRHPGIPFDYSDLNHETMRQVSGRLDTLMRDCPEAAGYLEYVGSTHGPNVPERDRGRYDNKREETTYAMTSTYLPEGVGEHGARVSLTFNPDYFGAPADQGNLHVAFEEAGGFAPKGKTTLAGVATHEYGHVVEQALHSSDNPDARAAINGWLNHYGRNPKTRVSGYGMEGGAQEMFAESFAELVYGPKDIVQRNIGVNLTGDLYKRYLHGKVTRAWE